MKQPYNTTIYNTALYLRLSRDDELQGESGSIQTQRMMLRQYAAEHGLTVVDEYIHDAGVRLYIPQPIFSTHGECTGNVFSTPTPEAILLTVKVSAIPPFCLFSTKPSKIWILSLLPSLILT